MKAPALRLKRSNCLAFFLHEGKLRCKNYLTGTEFEGPPVLVAVLAKLERWRTLRGIERLFPEIPPPAIRRYIHRLVTLTAVVVRGGSLSKLEHELLAWETWGVEARFFHYSTKNFHSAPIADDDIRINRA